jgi:hypothetical protein
MDGINLRSMGKVYEDSNGRGKNLEDHKILVSLVGAIDTPDKWIRCLDNYGSYVK